MQLEPRINNPIAINRDQIAAILERGWRPTIQFSTPGASATLLRKVNSLCVEFGARLEVRFYGHYGTAFDASVLAALPDVAWLSIDCIDAILEPHRIADLRRLRKLSFGVYRFDDDGLLESLPLEQLERLALGPTARAGFDLAVLRRCAHLAELFLDGRMRSIEALADLPALEKLSIGSLPKKRGLQFLGRLRSLRSLTLILGGRPDIDEFEHDDMEALSIVRVRGFGDLGSLRRFPRLKTLQIEDQLQLRSLDLAGASLQSVTLMNCKSLERLEGLDDLTDLREFRVGQTSLDLDELVARTWPRSMDVVALYSGSAKWNATARAALDRRGYREASWTAAQPA